MPVPLLAFLGLFVGVAVEGVVSSYRHHGGFRPWPCCRDCGRRAPLVALVPLLGLLAAPHCPAPGCGRSWWSRALQVQVATGIAFVALGGQYAAYPALLAVSLCEAALLVALLFIDLELRLIPTLLVVLIVVLALGSAAFWPGLGLGSALAGGAIGFASFGALVLLARLIFGEGALGMGDANLALAIGCITGYPLVAFTLSVGVFLGGLGAAAILLGALVARRAGVGLRSTIPYGPYLVLGALYVLAHGNTLNPLVRF